MTYLPIGAPLGLGATSQIIPIKGDVWVNLWADARNQLGRLRGTRPGASIPRPGDLGGRFHYPNIPRTTCGDVAAMFDGWATELYLNNLFGATGRLGRATAWALQNLRMQLRADCGGPAQEYPFNDQFWNYTRALSIEQDSKKAIPGTWELVVESASESWDEFTDKTGQAVKGAAAVAGSTAFQFLFWPAVAFGVIYFGVIRGDR